MEKSIGAFEIRRKFGKVLQEVIATGDRFVIERHGEPVAAVVPINVYNQWKRARSEFFEKLRIISERANLSPEETEALVSEAVRAVRGNSPR